MRFCFVPDRGPSSAYLDTACEIVAGFIGSLRIGGGGCFLKSRYLPVIRKPENDICQLPSECDTWILISDLQYREIIQVEQHVCQGSLERAACYGSGVRYAQVRMTSVGLEILDSEFFSNGGSKAKFLWSGL